MKKLIAVVLLAVMLISPFSVGAYAAFGAYSVQWSLKASVMDASANQNTDKDNYSKATNLTVYDSLKKPSAVCVYPGQVVWVTMHIKTGSSFYAGSLQAQIYYTNNIFQSVAKQDSFIWRNSGAYMKNAYYQGTPYAQIHESYRNNFPENWNQSKRDAHEFYQFIAFPDVKKSTNTVANVNEDIVTVPVYVKKDAKIGSTGSIFITKDDQLTPSNTTGRFFLSYYEKSNLDSKQVKYSNKIDFDTSAAELKFIVGSKNGMAISESSVDMNYKSTTQLSAFANGVDSSKITWTSSNPNVASVDKNGNVTATGTGSAVITASYGDYSASCNVNVNYSFLQWIIVIVLFGWIWY